MATFFHWQEGDLILKLTIQPKAAHDTVVGIHDGRLKVRITAPPFDNLANDYMIKWLAKSFKIPKNHVILEKGHQSRQKQFKLQKPSQLPDWFKEYE